MVKNHTKRINAPRRWNVLRKSQVFITRPNPGRDFSLCISLNVALKDMLHKANTTKESKYLIKNQEVLVNKMRRFDEKFPLGFLDSLSFPLSDEHYRLVVDRENKLCLIRIRAEEAGLKLSKVSNKHILSKEKVQINCTDGRNFLFNQDDKAVKAITTNDSLFYTLPDQKLNQIIKLEKGCVVYLYKGKHIGNVVSVDDFKGENIIFKINDDVFETKKAYAFVVGKEKPVMTLSDKSLAMNKTTVESEKTKPAFTKAAYEEPGKDKMKKSKINRIERREKQEDAK